MTVEHDLMKVPLFAGLTPEQLKEVTRTGRTQFVPANTVIYKEHDPGDMFYVVLDGAVRIYISHKNDREVDLLRLQVGDWFGELDLLDGTPRKVRATTISPCQFFLWARTDFLNLLTKSPLITSRVFQKLSAKFLRVDLFFGELRFQDERVRAQAEIQRHRSISQMVAGVAHEINTPLGIITNAASLLSEKLTQMAIPASAKDTGSKATQTALLQAAKLIQSNAARTANLVETFKKLSARNITSRKEQVDIASLTEETMELYRLQARKSKLQLEMVDDLGQRERIWDGFPEKYTQVILNLLTNIDRYAYPGGVGGEVVVKVSQQTTPGKKTQFCVVVQDFGGGIPKEDLPKVFDAFFTTGRALGGTGLGLAIVHNLITSALHGTISITSEPGQGTRVEIQLPKIVQDDKEETPAQISKLSQNFKGPDLSQVERIPAVEHTGELDDQEKVSDDR